MLKMKRFIQQFMQAASAVAAALLAGDWAARYAYACRKYDAIGGEYLFVPVVYLSVYAGSGWLLDMLEQLRCRRSRGRQVMQAGRDDKEVAGRC